MLNTVIGDDLKGVTKEINSLRAQLRYMKKSVMYRGGGCGCNVEENRRDIVELEKEIKRLCKLRDCAKAMEKASGLKMGEMDRRTLFLATKNK